MQELQFMYPELNLIPDEVLDGIQVYNFSQYVKELKVVKKYIDPSRKMLKCGYHDEIIELDDRAMQFFINHYTEDSIYDVKDEHYLIYKKKFNKETEKKLFSPFFSTKPNGQGIGLIFIREVLQKQNCSFSLRTYTDGLTRFRILFE